MGVTSYRNKGYGYGV